MKNLKKLFIICFIFFTVQITTYWSACSSSCKIKDETPEVLLDYIDNLRTVISNITEKTVDVDKDKWIVKDYRELKSQMIQLYNMWTNWGGYFSYFEFYVIYPISNEYVYEVWRDYKMLDEEWKWIEKYKKALITRWLSDFEISKEEICEWIEDQSCNFEWWEVLKVLAKVQENNEKVKDYFRLSILDKKKLFIGDIMLVWDDFKQEFNKYYNESTTADCSSCEWGFFKKIETAVENITNLQTLAKDWIKEWKDAIALIDWSLSDKEYEAREREILKNELQNQWIGWWWADAILNNLDKYNENAKTSDSWIWFTKDNNFITNSFNSVVSSLWNQISEFKENVLQNFKFWEIETISLDKIGKTQENILLTNEISDRINFMYKKELPWAQMQDTENDKLRSRLIEMHYDINQAIKVLDWAIKISQKVCNDQARGRWKCDYWN